MPQQAYLAKSLIENANIYVFLQDELTVQVHNFYSNAIGGIKLQVPEDKAEEAYKILEAGNLIIEKIEIDDVKIIEQKTKKCPFCGSNDFEIQKNSSILEKIVLGFLSLFLPSLKTYKCNSCNQKWNIKHQ